MGRTGPLGEGDVDVRRALELLEKVIYCNRTATRPVQASTQRTSGRQELHKIPANQHNFRTRQYGLKHAKSNSG